jgi:ATP-binding cassette subfamily C protein
MKYRFVRQHSEEDCGAACLATIAKHYGKTFTISRIRETVGTGQRGTTLLGLKRGAEALGFNAKAGRGSEEILEKDAAQLPAIIHWKGYHYVVLYGRKGKNYVVADPAIGIRYVTRKELLEAWTSYIILLLEPDPVRFAEQEDEKLGGFGRFVQRVLPYRMCSFRQHCLVLSSDCYRWLRLF